MEEQQLEGRLSEVLEVASEAGHILLENGAEISRVEDIMSRIAAHYGVDSSNFFVLSNGIFTTGTMNRLRKSGGQSETYANVEFIPIRSIQLSKVIAVNRLSYDIASGFCSLEQARERLRLIRQAPPKPAWEQILGSAFGAAGFAAVFGGGWMDCAAAFVVGVLLYVFILFVSSRYLSKIVGGISNALLATFLCVLFYRIGFGQSLSNMIIGSIMPLIPGVPFVNGVRDLANSDYIAGLTRLTDAMLGFFCIALGVAVSFLLDGLFFDGMIVLQGMTVNPETAGLGVQTLAAFVGTLAFASLFGVPRAQYVSAGLIGAIGWCLYLVLVRYAGCGVGLAITLSSLLICLLSRWSAVWQKCPAQVFLLCGIFPLVPGAGIFWCTYYLVSEHLSEALATGFGAVKAAVAIVLGIILAMELPQRIFSGRRRHDGRSIH
ncbi:MAG: threonine/serine exporter family protein [Bacteroidales bacterium]|nr:threonine/serine exporter family protein [Bacteroidales bacterium]